MFFSLVIPTRNRQYYAKYAVRVMLQSTREDIEVIVADNSDDPDEIRKELGGLLFDRRLKLVPSAERVLSMRENWERALAHTGGEWVCFVGDDDAAMPEIPDFLSVFAPQFPEIEVVEWNRVMYAWPDNRRPGRQHLRVTLSHEVSLHASRNLLEHAFAWRSEGASPGGGAGIYHGAVRRSLIERVKSKRNQAYFRYETVDFDSGYTSLMETAQICTCRRPLSIMGACGKSNSSGIGRFDQLNQRIKEWLDDGNLIDGLHLSPIPPFLSVTAAVLAMQLHFANDYPIGLPKPDWERIFKALAKDCEKEDNREMFELKVSAIRQAIEASEIAPYLGLFQPEFIEKKEIEAPYYGLMGNELLMDPEIADISDTYKLYSFLQGIIPAVNYIGTNITFQKR